MYRDSLVGGQWGDARGQDKDRWPIANQCANIKAWVMKRGRHAD